MHFQNNPVWQIYNLLGETPVNILPCWACHGQKEQYYLCRTWVECKLKCHVSRWLSQNTPTPPQSNKYPCTDSFEEPANETSLYYSVFLCWSIQSLENTVWDNLFISATNISETVKVVANPFCKGSKYYDRSKAGIRYTKILIAYDCTQAL